jgi:hypothetical protein
MAAETYAMEAVSDLASLMADEGKVDIRLEAALAKMWNTELGWRIVDDTLQIKGGRGYETADSLRSRGEKPDAVERMMRDFRINLIFEGSSEVMRLFIAREAVDTHFKIAGALIDPKAPMKAKVNALLKSALFYGVWYPRQWLSLRGRFGFGEVGRLAGHMRFVERRSRKLGRTIFHCMVRFGPKLEKRQAVLGRIVEIGAELFAMAATCARAVAAGQWGTTGKDAVELADAFCRQASRRVDEKFAAVWRNDDVNTYAVARKVLDGGYSWLERGMVGTRGD